MDIATAIYRERTATTTRTNLPMNDKARIKAWMFAHAKNHIDQKTNELNLTSIVEEWDHEVGDGHETMTDADHPAWDIAIEVKEEFEKAHSQKERE